jgi:hypothetical protein
MITIKVVPVAKHETHRQDFYKSIDAQASDKDSYEVISLGETPDPNSCISIYLPDDCLVLGNSWDKYVLHALDNGLPQGDPERPECWMTWRMYVIRRLGLTDRNHSGIYPDLKVELPVATA